MNSVTREFVVSVDDVSLHIWKNLIIVITILFLFMFIGLKYISFYSEMISPFWVKRKNKHSVL